MTIADLIVSLAIEMGAVVELEPTWKRLCRITFKNGGVFIVKPANFTVNLNGPSKIANDKNAADYFLQLSGFPIVPNSELFFRRDYAEQIDALDHDIDAAYAYAERLGWPVIVKPNSGSQGSGVALVHNKEQFYDSMEAIFVRFKTAMVQSPFKGEDYRLVVLGDDFITAYKRAPLSVVGDGQTSIRDLLLTKTAKLEIEGRKVRFVIDDPRIANKLSHQGFSYNFVPAEGQKIFLLDNANLSTGGDAVDVSAEIHPQYQQIAIKIAKTMGLQLCGVDLLIDGDISEPPTSGGWCVIEINATPGLDHYFTGGPEQVAVVEDLYRRALRMIEASLD